jgi:hypothetical protein
VGKTPACNQNNVFMDRIKDELDGEGYKTFVTPMDKSKVDISANGAGWFYTFCVKLPLKFINHLLKAEVLFHPSTIGGFTL